jgi:hypothetical protein
MAQPKKGDRMERLTCVSHCRLRILAPKRMSRIQRARWGNSVRQKLTARRPRRRAAQVGPYTSRRNFRPRMCADSDGYMAVDALVAMTMLASTIVFALSAGHQALDASRAGLEVRQARDLLTYIVENSRDAEGATAGRTDAFVWRLAVDPPLPSAAAESLCAHAVTVTSLRTAKSYGVATAEICPAPAAS